MYRFRSSKYLVTTVFVTSLLTVLGYSSSFIKIPGIETGGYLQLADIVGLSLTTFIPGPMLLFASPIAMSLSDILGSAPIFIPATIITRVLMYFIVRILEKYLYLILLYFFAVLPILLIYPVYTWMLYDKSAAIKELITDIIQVISTYFFALFFTWFLIKIDKASINNLWDDQHFDHLKSTPLQNKEENINENR